MFNKEYILENLKTRKVFDELVLSDKTDIAAMKKDSNDLVWQKISFNQALLAGFAFFAGSFFVISLEHLHSFSRVLVCSLVIITIGSIISLLGKTLKNHVVLYALAEEFFLSILITKHLSENFPEESNQNGPGEDNSAQASEPKSTELH